MTVFKVVTGVAVGAVSVISMGFALVGNRNTDMFGIEGPSVRTGEAFLVLPVP